MQNRRINMDKFMEQLMEIEALFMTLTQAMEHCCDNKKSDTNHLLITVEKIEKRISILHLDMKNRPG